MDAHFAYLNQITDYKTKHFFFIIYSQLRANLTQIQQIKTIELTRDRQKNK